MAKYNHIHKYLRDKLGKLVIYKCALPGCSHYLASNLAIGKVTVCWYCGAEFVMDRKSVQLKRPHCKNCVVAHNAKPRLRGEERASAAELTDTFLSDVLPKVAGEK